MKKFLRFLTYFISIASFATFSPMVLHAQTNQNNSFASLKSRAQQEINRRVTAMNDEIKQVNKVKSIPTADTMSLKSQLQTNISSLSALNKKISGDTNLPTLKVDVQSIIDSYRIFALLLPQVRITVTADKILTLSNQEASLAAALQQKLGGTQTVGNTLTSSTSATLMDLQNKIDGAKMKANASIKTVTPLKPSGYPANKKSLESARADLDKARQDLLAGVADAVKLIEGLVPSVTGTTSGN